MRYKAPARIRTKAVLKYCEGVQKPVTPQRAKSLAGVAGYAGQQGREMCALAEPVFKAADLQVILFDLVGEGLDVLKEFLAEMHQHNVAGQKTCVAILKLHGAIVDLGMPHYYRFHAASGSGIHRLHIERAVRWPEKRGTAAKNAGVSIGRAADFGFLSRKCQLG